jgi:hypothetical protein
VIVLLAVYALGTHARICGRGSSEWLKSTDALAAPVELNHQSLALAWAQCVVCLDFKYLAWIIHEDAPGYNDCRAR